MFKAVILRGQLSIDFDAPPRLPPIPPRLLTPDELRAQTDRNRKAMEGKLRGLPPKILRAVRLRDPYYSTPGWRIDGVLSAIPEFDRIAGFASQPSAMDQWEIMREFDLPHGSIMYLRCIYTHASVLVADRSAEGRYQDLPLLG